MTGKVSRRTALRLTALAAAAPTLSQLIAAPVAHAQAQAAGGQDDGGNLGELVDVSIAQLRAAMAARRTTSREITSDYLERIRRLDPKLHSVIETNPDALDIAEDLHEQRHNGHVLGPLHGIPILLKDNIDTADQT